METVLKALVDNLPNMLLALATLITALGGLYGIIKTHQKVVAIQVQTNGHTSALAALAKLTQEKADEAGKAAIAAAALAAEKSAERAAEVHAEQPKAGA